MNYNWILSAAAIFFTVLSHNEVTGANILFYGIVGSYSQRISMWPLIESLADKGHNVTFISSYESRDPHPKVHDYAPKKWKETMGGWEDHIKFFDIRKNKQMVKSWVDMAHFGVLSCSVLYEDDEFVDWITSSKFDLVFVDALFNECAYSIINFHKAKFIVFGTATGYSWFFDSFGLPSEASAVTELAFNFPPGKEMAFWQRFANAIHPVAWTLLRQYWYFPAIEEISKKGLGHLGKHLPSFAELEKNASLIMITTHYSVDYPRSFPPNVIPVGGLVSASVPKPLPKILENLINKSENGFVYISFGTVTEFTNFSPSVRQEFINAINKFPHMQFIWKSSFEIQEELPNHVFVTKWAPQLSLLAHPKIRLFISHTGMGSTAEAIEHAVPVISLPVLTDQDLNGEVLASRGAAIKLEITTLKQHELENAIHEILENPKYRQRMKKVSQMYKDRPMSVLDNAVWWTEYVLRNDDTNEFLRSPSIEQPWWIRRHIDVWIVALLLLCVLITLPIVGVYLLLYWFRRLFCNTKKNFNGSKTKKQKVK